MNSQKATLRDWERNMAVHSYRSIAIFEALPPVLSKKIHQKCHSHLRHRLDQLLTLLVKNLFLLAHDPSFLPKALSQNFVRFFR